VSILAQITRRRVVILVPVAVVDVAVKVDDLVALAVAVGVLTPRTAAQTAA
jgi:hypothetical protein